MVETRTTIYIDKSGVVKGYLGFRGTTIKEYINTLIAEDIKHNAPEDIVIKYFKS